MPNRALRLRKESLTELAGSDLAAVAGGEVSRLCIEATYPCVDTNIPTRCMCTGYYPSLNAPCDTLLRPLTPIVADPDTLLC